jgi:hypothetical protein
MHKLLIALFSLSLLAAAQDQSHSAISNREGDNAPALTIYNQNFFVAREYLPLDLNTGVNHVNFAGITSHLEPDSVILRDLTGRPLQILEQSYRNDPVSQELLLSFYEGKTIDFLVQPGAVIRGKIIRSGYVPISYYQQQNYGYQPPSIGQPIIEIDGILRFGLPGQPLFPALASDSILKPTLSWELSTTQAGKSQAEISYVSGGMTWQSDYNLVVSDGPKNSGMNSLDLVGWITMRNQSGKTFENARIKLLAGDVSKIQPPMPMAKAAYAVAGAMAMDEAQAPVVREKSFDEFHLYTLERPATLRDNETKQVEFVRTTGIQSQRLYVYDGAQVDQYGYANYEQIRNDPGYGTATNKKVYVLQEFKNSEANHLGIALPKGRLRFYRRDTDGSLQFVGENTIDHTPKDEMLRIYTGNAFDIVGERKRTNYRVDSSAHWMDETFEIRVRNHKKESANVRVVEHLYRWTNWKVTEQSHQFKKRDAQTIEFPVTVAPDGEQIVTYTVHYSW